MASAAIDGLCDPRLRGVRETFVENFARYGEVGAAVAVTIDGRPVVDLWAGHADAARTRRWARDTIVNIASATKGLTAICAHRLADRGLLDLDAPVAAYWPEFAQAGKAAIPVHLLLSHRAGLPAIDAPLPTEALYAWDTMTRALAAQAPWWEPGTRHGYHAFTFGWLVGEVVRRITGKSLGRYWREEVAGPLGIDCHIGLAAEDDARVAEFIPCRRVSRTSRQSAEEGGADDGEGGQQPAAHGRRHEHARLAKSGVPAGTRTPTRGRWPAPTGPWPAARR